MPRFPKFTNYLQRITYNLLVFLFTNNFILFQTHSVKQFSSSQVILLDNFKHQQFQQKFLVNLLVFPISNMSMNNESSKRTRQPSEEELHEFQDNDHISSRHKAITTYQSIAQRPPLDDGSLFFQNDDITLEFSVSSVFADIYNNESLAGEIAYLAGQYKVHFDPTHESNAVSISQPTPPSPSQIVPHAIGPSITQPTSKRRKKGRQAHHQVDNHQPTSYPPVEDPLRPGPVPRPPPEPPPPYPKSPSRTHCSDLRHNLAVMQAQLDLPTVISLHRTTEGQLLNLSGNFELYRTDGALMRRIQPGSATDAINQQLFIYDLNDQTYAYYRAHYPERYHELSQSFPASGWFTLPSKLNKLPQYLSQQLITGYFTLQPLHSSLPKIFPTVPSLLPQPQLLPKALKQAHITAFFPSLQAAPFTASWPRLATFENKSERWNSSVQDTGRESVENEASHNDNTRKKVAKPILATSHTFTHTLTTKSIKERTREFYMTHTKGRRSGDTQSPHQQETINYSDTSVRNEIMSERKKRKSRKTTDNYHENKGEPLTSRPHPLPLLSTWITHPTPLIKQPYATPLSSHPQTSPLLSTCCQNCNVNSAWNAHLS